MVKYICGYILIHAFVTCRLICAQEELQKLKTENAQVSIKQVQLWSKFNNT